MFVAVARDRAISAERSRVDKFEPPICRGLGVDGIEIDEVSGVLNAVRVMTGDAGGFVVHHMEAVREALVSEDAVAAVTFITKGVIRDAFRIEIGQEEIALEQRTKG